MLVLFGHRWERVTGLCRRPARGRDHLSFPWEGPDIGLISVVLPASKFQLFQKSTSCIETVKNRYGCVKAQPDILSVKARFSPTDSF